MPELIENEEEEDKEEYEEEDKNINDENIKFKECVIKIKLYESINGGYEIHFNKAEGDLMKYYGYYSEIKTIIQNIIKKK